MNRLALTLTVGLTAMEACWVAPWSMLIGLWTDAGRPQALLSAPSIFLLVLLGALSTQTFGRRAAISRSARLGVAGLGLVAVLVAVRADQYPDSGGLEWLRLTAGALAVVLGQPGGPALAFALGLFLWWRGVRLGSQTASFADAESLFHWGIGLLVGFALVMALTTRPSRAPALEAQTTPFVVGFFFVSLLTLALARLESLRTRTRALALNTQWLGVLILVTGMVVLVALLIGQLVSFDVLLVATRPIFDLLGKVLLLAIYVVVIPLAYVIEWIVYLLLNIVGGRSGQQAPQPLQPGDVDRRLQSVLSLEISPELAAGLKALGAAVLLVAALLVVARAASRWRLSSADADATEEQRDSVWEPGRLKRIVLAWLRRLFRLGVRGAREASSAGEVAGSSERAQAGRVSSIRELYRRLLRLGEAAGTSRALATTPLEHVGALQLALEPADDVVHLTRAYNKVRYADIEPSSSEAAVAQDQFDRLHPRSAEDTEPVRPT